MYFTFMHQLDPAHKSKLVTKGRAKEIQHELKDQSWNHSEIFKWK